MMQRVSRFWSAARAVMLATAILAVCGIASAAPDSRYIRLTILHTNDTHSHLLPFNYPEVVKRNGEELALPAHRNLGGIARRATLIKQIKCERGAQVLVMDAGDQIDGSPFSIEFAGEADYAAFNAAGYEVAVTGNHEYSNTFANFQKRKAQARFALLGANVFRQGDTSPFLTPSIIKTEDGLRVAILGLVIPNNYTAVAQGKLEIKDPIQVAKEWVPKLRGQADAVILLTHIGYELDVPLAKQVPGIDAIIGGHSHTRLEKPVLVKSDADPQAFSVGGTVVAQDFQWGGDLGRVDLIFHKSDSGWTLMSYAGGLIPITSAIPEDPQVRAVVENYHSRIAAKYDAVLGEATADFTEEAPYNLASDAFRERLHTDFAVHNYGGVRTELVKGPITFGDVAMMIPFTDDLLTFTLTGAQLKQILRASTPAVANIKYRVEKGELISAELGGQPIDDAKTYTGVTHGFYAGYALPKELALTNTHLKSRDVVAQYIQQRKAITPDNENRAAR